MSVHPFSHRLYVNNFRTSVNFCYILQWGKRKLSWEVLQGLKKKKSFLNGIALRNFGRVLQLTLIRSYNDITTIGQICFCWSPSLLLILAFAVVPPWAGKFKCKWDACLLFLQFITLNWSSRSIFVSSSLYLSTDVKSRFVIPTLHTSTSSQLTFQAGKRLWTCIFHIHHAVGHESWEKSVSMETLSEQLRNNSWSWHHYCSSKLESWYVHTGYHFPESMFFIDNWMDKQIVWIRVRLRRPLTVKRLSSRSFIDILIQVWHSSQRKNRYFTKSLFISKIVHHPVIAEEVQKTQVCNFDIAAVIVVDPPQSRRIMKMISLRRCCCFFFCFVCRLGNWDVLQYYWVTKVRQQRYKLLHQWDLHDISEELLSSFASAWIGSDQSLN